MKDDKILFEKIASGDRDAFDLFVLKYQTQIMHIAYGMLLNHEDALDVTQEVFIKVYRSIKSFRHDSAPSTWLYRITKNMCIDFLRKRKLSTISLDDDSTSSPRLDIKDTSPSPQALVESDEAKTLIHDALSRLDYNSRLVITMYDIEGISYEEISKALFLPIGTVKSRLNRARGKLRKILSEKREHFL